LIVLDSSAVIDYLLGLEPEASWVRDRIVEAETRVHAPHLLDVEVLGVIRAFVLVRSLPEPNARLAVRALGELPLRRYPHVQLLDRVWELKAALSAPDATFVALAEALDIPLVTTDRRLARAHGPRIPIVSP
jgi:predicted nucleic acid-binding protein